MSITGTSAAAAVTAELGDARHAAGGASASTPRTLAAGPSLLELLKDIEDWTLLDNGVHASHVRAILPDYHWTENPEDSEFLAERPSPTSSMAVSISAADAFFERSTASSRASLAYTPSFGPCSTAKSASSVQISSIESPIERYGLDVDENGVLVAPAPNNHEGSWVCLFDFLDCRLRFNSAEEWDTHCKWHLRGHLPRKLECPFACRWKVEAASGDEAWEQRTLHIVAEHAWHERGSSRRPAQSLLDHMRRCDVIDSATYKELSLHGRVLEGYVFTASAGPMQDRRRDRRQRGPDRRR